MAYEWYPKYVTFLPEARLDSVLHYAQTDLVPVVFDCDQVRLKPTPQLDSIVGVIRRVAADPRVELAYVWVGGSASPEGPLERNRWLGGTRARMLANYLKEYAGVADSVLRVENLWEDWYSVERRLRTIDFPPYREQLLDIIATETDWERRKRRIKALDGERTWWRLINQVFPPYRNARIVIVCHAEAIRPLPLAGAAAVPIMPVPVEPPLFRLRPVAFVPLAPLQPVRRRFFALKGNLLGYCALEANLGVEAELWPRTSIDIPVWYSPYDFFSPTRKARLLGVQPELRYWLGTRAGQGHYLGIHGHVLGFNIELNRHARYQDPNHALWGLGLGYGYATHLDRRHHWLLEASVGVGYANYQYDSYRWWVNGPKYRSRDRGEWWGPTRLGLTLGYKWYARRGSNGKKGGAHAEW